MTLAPVSFSTEAHGKVNLCLFLGPTRADGLHELVSVVAPLDLADTVRLEPAPGAEDEIVCRGVEGDNLALRAVRLFRERVVPALPPQRVMIAKRVPVAAGMGGGSADAAAVLRLLAGAPDDTVRELAFALGADVPALLHGGRVLMEGAGEHVSPLPAEHPGERVIVVLPSRHHLSTPAVYREADRLGLGRDLAGVAERVRAADWEPHNDLQLAAISLCPEIEGALARLRDAGAEHALVAGSGPTTFGLFPPGAAAQAAAIPGTIVAREVSA